MNYTCRDCGETNLKKPINSCPKCHSIYLIPSNYKQQKNKPSKITINDRFMGVFIGLIGGIAFLIAYLILCVFTGRPAIYLMVEGAKFFIPVSIVFAIIGFMFGPVKVIDLFSIIWGTNKEFNDKHADFFKKYRIIITLILFAVFSYIFFYLIFNFMHAYH